jgi:dethiobiotin synthetase
MESKPFYLSINSDFNICELKTYKAICITGTDTGIGKTVVTGLLAKELSKMMNITTQKWVQSGGLDHPDIQTHDNFSGITHLSDVSNDRQVYSFKTPASPHLAAKIEGQNIQLQELMNATNRLKATHDMVLVETSGGIMVPLNGKETTGDIIKHMALPTIVVVPNKLGTINHTLLTIHYLNSKEIPILGLIINQIEAEHSIIHDNNPKTIQEFGKIPIIATCHQLNKK